MDYIDHDHKMSIPRGGKVLTGDNDYNGENNVIDCPEYDRFNMPTSYRSTGKVGVIQPCLCMHVTAGDQLELRANLFQRFQPLVSTPLTAIESSIHSFYVPYRMLDYGFEQFFTGGHDGNYKLPVLNINFNSRCVGAWDAQAQLLPFFASGILPNGYDAPYYFGKPLGGVGSLLEDFNFGVQAVSSFSTDQVKCSCALNSPCNVFMLLAYHRIYNDFYRVPEIEPDLFLHTMDKDLKVYADSIKTLIGSSTATDYYGYSVRDLLYEWLHSSEVEGFLSYMSHLLTDPLLHNYLMAEVAKPSAARVANSWTLTSKTSSAFYSTKYGQSFDLSAASILLLGTSAADSDAVFNYEYENGDTVYKVSDFDICLFAFACILTSCRNAPYERDRFNSVLPYLQRGEMAKLVKRDIAVNINTNNGHNMYPVDQSIFENGSLTTLKVNSFKNGNDVGYLATNITVNDLRELNAVSKFLEKNSLVGYRFDEYVNGEFGIDVKGTDHMSKPSYIGGIKNYVNMDVVTSPSSTAGSVQGQQSAVMTLYEDNHVGHFNCPEPGIVLAVLQTKPRTGYINSIDRNNYKISDRTTLFTPEFAHLQEQPLFTPEICAFFYSDAAQGPQTPLSDLINGELSDITGQWYEYFFGYERRYNEYINNCNHVGGELMTDQLYNTTARVPADLTNVSLTTVPNQPVNDYYWQHVMFDDPSVARIFTFINQVSDQFMFNVGWDIEKVTVQPKNAQPKL